MKKIFFFIAIVFSFAKVIGQNVGIGTTTPDASALLELRSTNQGFLPPQMTALQKTNIPSPKKGLMIYQTDGVQGLYVYDGAAWIAAAGAGNFVDLSTSQIINGTKTFNADLYANGIRLGRGGSAVVANTAIGQDALLSNTTGTSNTATGFQSLDLNNVGNFNTANGSYALYENASGNENTAIGTGAMIHNTTGSSNTASGYYALAKSISGNNNTAVGDQSLFYNLAGNSNVAVGYSALFSNKYGYSNVAIGSHALYINTVGNNSIAIGDSALYSSSEDINIAIGSKALYHNTTGFINTAIGYKSLFSNSSGYGNTANGYQSLYWNTIGERNTATGNTALQNNSQGSRNTSIGNESMANNTFGDNNTALGADALWSNTVGSYNTALGYNATVFSNNLTNATAIGALAAVNCSNCMILGSISGTNGATSNTNIGIGTTNPQADLHVNPNAAGSILIGTNKNSGGYTDLEMGISQQSGGYSYIQSTQASGSTYGNLSLNQNGGNVGIRIATPLAPLHIKQSTESFPVNGGGLRLERATNANHWDVGTDTGDDIDFTFNGAWRFWFSNIDGTLTTSSDLRLKKDIQLIGNVLPAVMQLKPKTYHYKDAQTVAPLSYGFIAQEVQNIFPDFVKTKGDDKMNGITYQYFSVIAIKAIQEQQQQIEASNEKNKMMMKIIEKMQEEIEALKQKIK